MNIENLINAYYQHNFGYLSTHLRHAKKRIPFEEWMLSEAHSLKDFNWQTKVLSLLCTKAQENNMVYVEEDLKIASLIAAFCPLPNGHLEKIADFIGKQLFPVNELNFFEIISTIEHNNLPFTSLVLIKRIDPHYILLIASLKNNMAVAKELSKRDLKTFKSSVANTLPGTLTPVHYAVSRSHIELLKLIAVTAHDELKLALEIKDDKGMTPINYAIGMANMEMLKLMVKINPEAFRSLKTLIIKGQNPIHDAVNKKNQKLCLFLAKHAENAFIDALKIKDSQGLTPIHSAFLKNHMYLARFLMGFAPQEFHSAINSLVDHAVMDDNLEILEFLAKEGGEEFKRTLIVTDDEGETPIHIAAATSNLKILMLMANAAPNEFRKAMGIRNKRNFTPIWLAINHFEMIRLIFDRAPDELITAIKKDLRLLLISDENDRTLLHHAALSNSPDSLAIAKMVESIDSEIFRNVMTMQDKHGKTPLFLAASNSNSALVEWIAWASPNEYTRALEIADKNGETPLHKAVKKENTDIVLLFSKESVFQRLLLFKDASGKTPFHRMVKSLAMTKILSQEKEIFKIALLKTDHQKQTPLHLANEEVIEFIFNEANCEFHKSLKIKDKLNNTPLNRNLNRGGTKIAELLGGKIKFNKRFIFQAFQKNHYKVIIFLAKNNPDAFRNILSNISFHEIKDAHMLKTLYEVAPDKFQKEHIEFLIKDSILKNNINLLECFLKIEPEIFKSTVIKNRFNKLNHETAAFLIKHIPDEIKNAELFKEQSYKYNGLNKVYKNDPSIRVFKEVHKRKALSHAFNLKGFTNVVEIKSNECLLTKDLEGYISEPWFRMMRKDFDRFALSYPGLLNSEQLIQLFESSEISTSDQLVRIQKGLPCIINTGFINHTVTLLIFGNRLVICNRGDVTRRHLEIYHFNPLKLDISNLHEIKLNKSKEEYIELFFKKLPVKLEFRQTALDRELESAHFLPAQIVGNCSFVSPITAVYAFLLLITGKEKAFSHYRTWLGFQQLCILERALEPSPRYAPDRLLISAALRKAHLLPLDENSRQRLRVLTENYVDTLSEIEKKPLEIDLLYWKTIY